MAMTREELASILTIYAADDYEASQDPLIEAIVDDAIEEVIHAKFPYVTVSSDADKDKLETHVLTHHISNIRRIMEYHYDKIGKEGVTTFYEAGQTTSWESGGTPDSFFKGIIPVAKLV